ncbi:hypothetical protein F8388_005186 [Cannabis sativa]|uniref:Zinc knuckle CX2CX4HX4C domain-containing protein n=1 Tax=Cannabis sativa TaxID=3483 RepID=A0A7J6ECT5_CANSA|nr:hypothetical protein F8388_005186 [Cannabis sativa]KAF4400641.1 hypothetical protein G4B88_023049 [Cannabis sativa]
MDDPGFWAEFKYKYVPTFCFICGVIGHSEKFYSKLFEVSIENTVKSYGVWMRAQPWRRNNLIGSQWLWDGNELDMEFVGRSTSTSAAVGGWSVFVQADFYDGCDSLIVLDTKRRRMVESQLGRNQVEGSNVGRINVEGSIVGRINEEGVDVVQNQVVGSAGDDICTSDHCLLLLEPIISNFVVPFRQFLFENA